MSDKVMRIQAYARTGCLQNEGVVENLLDIADYAIAALILFEEQT